MPYFYPLLRGTGVALFIGEQTNPSHSVYGATPTTYAIAVAI